MLMQSSRVGKSGHVLESIEVPSTSIATSMHNNIQSITTLGLNRCAVRVRGEFGCHHLIFQHSR